MGAAPRRKIADLIKSITTDGASFEFFQALRLIENLWSEHGAIGTGTERRLRVRSAPEISFPASDLRRVKMRDDGVIELEANFLGLYGVDAPVPLYLLDMVSADDEAAHRLRAFLDVFNHRMYALYYMAWKKYHAVVQLEHKEQAFRSMVSRIIGSITTVYENDELYYASTIALRSQSEETIAEVIRSVLGGVAVRVYPFQPSWVPLAGRQPLGAGNSLVLGDGTVLGDQVLDLCSKVLVQVGPLEPLHAMDILPGKDKGNSVSRILGKMLGPTSEFDLQILVSAGETQAQTLGRDNIVLGWASWLGEAAREPQSITVSGASYQTATSETNDGAGQFTGYEQHAAA